MQMILGPCAIQSEEHALKVAQELFDIQYNINKLGFERNIDSLKNFTIVYKSSYSKANRTKSSSFSGIGVDEGLRILQRVKDKFGFNVTSDVHTVEEIEKAKDVLDIIQIPHQMCRNSELLTAAGKTGKIVSVKKGTFFDPHDFRHIVNKIRLTGNRQPVIAIERGNMFGYDRTIVDMESFNILNKDCMGSTDESVLTCIDATHPATGPQHAEILAKAGTAAGADIVFLEVHDEPLTAPCDGHKMIRLKRLYKLILEILKIHEAVQL